MKPKNKIKAIQKKENLVLLQELIANHANIRKIFMVEIQK